MSSEENTIIVSCSLEENKSNGSIVQDIFAAENCSAKCPTCQQPCSYTAGHAGLHLCENGHEWV